MVIAPQWQNGLQLHEEKRRELSTPLQQLPCTTQLLPSAPAGAGPAVDTAGVSVVFERALAGFAQRFLLRLAVVDGVIPGEFIHIDGQLG